MNKKVLTLSLVAVAAIATSVATALVIKNNNSLTFGAKAEAKEIVLKKGNLKNVREDGGYLLFELHGKCAYDTERDYSITDGTAYGDTIAVGGDHIFTITTDGYWMFQMSVKIKGIASMNSFDSITYVGNFDGTTQVERTIDDFPFPSWDGEDESLTLNISEWNDDSGFPSGQTMEFDSITIDEIHIAYYC